jgi:phage terminase large subunit
MAGTQRIVIPYGPRRPFLDFHRRGQRWAVIVAHRRAGKTVACVNDLVRRAIQCPFPHGHFAYAAPFLAQAKEVAWEYLKRFSEPIRRDKNESELWVELVNGARVRVHGADNPNRLRGSYLDGVVLDEHADMRPSVWGEIIRPMLADRQGWAVFIGTPRGRNAFYDVWAKAQDDDDWYSLVLKASDSGILPATELEQAKREMTPEQYEQEFECSFDAAIRGSLFGREIAEAERAGRITDVPRDPSLPVHTVWDLGIGDAMAIWFFQVAGAEIRVIDHYENSGHAIPHYVAEIVARGYPHGEANKGDDWVPHDAKVRELSTGRTRIETLLSLNRKPRLVPDHKIMDGINGGRLVIPRCWFDKTRCAYGLEALRQARFEFDDKLNNLKDAPMKNWAIHTADAFRYLAMAWRELAAEPAPQKGRMVETPRGPVFVPDVDPRWPTLDEAWAQQTRPSKWRV